MRFRRTLALTVLVILTAIVAILARGPLDRDSGVASAPGTFRAPAQVAPSAPVVGSPVALGAGRTPSQEQPGSGSPSSGQGYKSSEAPDRFPDTRAGRLLNRHARVAFALGADAEKNYQASLVELRKEPKDVAELAMDAYSRAEVGDYNFKALMAETLSELRSVEARAALKAIATSPIPPEHGDDHYFTRIEDAAIRMAAVEGLGKLAATGDVQATETLKKVAVGSDNLTVQRAAVQAYLSTGDFGSRAAELGRILPASAKPLITLKTDSVQEASRGVSFSEDAADPAVPLDSVGFDKVHLQGGK